MTSLNLYTPGRGLFSTHVTWEDLEHDLQRGLNTTSCFGTEKSVKDIGDGNGFMSKILLIEPDWQPKDDKLPAKFLVKIATQLVMQKVTNELFERKNLNNNFISPTFMADFETLQKREHNTEVAVYKFLHRIPEGKIHVPKIFFSKNFTENNPVKGYIVMEYMENIKQIHVYESVTPMQLKQILRYKAVIEAYSLNVPMEGREEFSKKPFDNVYYRMFKQEVQEHIVQLFASVEDGKLVESVKRLKELIPDIVDLERAENLADELEMNRVVCHGDLWSMNMLWKPDGDDFKLAAVVDYQAAHFGCSATDLVRLFSSCLSGKERRAHWEELLEEFYGYLKEEVGERKMPYTLEQLKEAYRRYFPSGAFMVVTVIAPLFEVIFKNPDENQKMKCLETVMEKTVCLLEDIFYYHDRNVKIRNGQHVE
nr:Uncharacterised kinase D1044.1 domain containing protein [Haemonchus contortus]